MPSFVATVLSAAIGEKRLPSRKEFCVVRIKYKIEHSWYKGKSLNLRKENTELIVITTVKNGTGNNMLWGYYLC